MPEQAINHVYCQSPILAGERGLQLWWAIHTHSDTVLRVCKPVACGHVNLSCVCVWWRCSVGLCVFCVCLRQRVQLSRRSYESLPCWLHRNCPRIASNYCRNGCVGCVEHFPKDFDKSFERTEINSYLHWRSSPPPPLPSNPGTYRGVDALADFEQLTF